MLEVLRSAMEADKAVEAAWYYSSVARGEDGPGSDLDVAVAVRAGDVDGPLAPLREALEPAEDDLLVSFSLVGLSREDVRRLSAGDPWWDGFVRDAKVLVGVRPEALAARLRRRGRRRAEDGPQVVGGRRALAGTAGSGRDARDATEELRRRLRGLSLLNSKIE